MVSTKLVHQIESHWEAISGRFLRLLRSCSQTPHINRVPESDVVEASRKVLQNLGHWLVSSSEEEIARLYEKMGRDRFDQGVPLSESVRTIQLMKEATFSYVRDEATIQNSIDLYAEEELEHQLGRFFDLMTFNLTRGYEQACRPMQR